MHLSEINQTITISPCQNFGELCEALALVYSTYREQEYTSVKESKLHVTLSDLLPLSITMVARRDNDIIGTGGLIGDGYHRLPHADYFPSQYRNLTEDQITVEGTRFGVSSKASKIPSTLALGLIQWTVSFAIAMGCDNFVLTCNPKHTAWWQRFLGFELLATGATCRHVCGKPGDLLRLSAFAMKNPESLFSRRLVARGLFPMRESSDFGCCYHPSEDEVLLLLLAAPEILNTHKSYELRTLQLYFPWACEYALESKKSYSLPVLKTVYPVSAQKFLTNIRVLLAVMFRDFQITIVSETNISREEYLNTSLVIEAAKIFARARRATQHTLRAGTLRLKTFYANGIYTLDLQCDEANQRAFKRELAQSIIVESVPTQSIHGDSLTSTYESLVSSPREVFPDPSKTVSSS